MQTSLTLYSCSFKEKLFYMAYIWASGPGAIKVRRSYFWSQSHFSLIYSITESETEIKSETVSPLWPRGLMYFLKSKRMQLIKKYLDFRFLMALLSALYILLSPSELLTIGQATYWFTVSHHTDDDVILFISIFYFATCLLNKLSSIIDLSVICSQKKWALKR